MLAILVAFGAALFIWFHNDSSPTVVDSACHVSETVAMTVEPLTIDFTEQVFETNDASRVSIR